MCPSTRPTLRTPTNPYGESKLIVEKMLKWCDLAHGLKFCALRYFNVAGAWHDGSIGEDHRPESHLIPLILQVAQGKREQLSLFGTDYPTKDGTCIRDYIHVEDLIDAHFLALDYLKRTNTSAAFNLGNGQGFSNREIIEAARRVTGHPIPVREEGRRPGDPATLIASSRKAMEVLGWQPKYTNVEDIIASAWRWHSSHPRRLRRLTLNRRRTQLRRRFVVSRRPLAQPVAFWITAPSRPGRRLSVISFGRRAAGPARYPLLQGSTQPRPTSARGRASRKSRGTFRPFRAKSTLNTPVHSTAAGYTHRRPSSHRWKKDRAMSTIATG